MRITKTAKITNKESWLFFDGEGLLFRVFLLWQAERKVRN